MTEQECIDKIMEEWPTEGPDEVPEELLIFVEACLREHPNSPQILCAFGDLIQVVALDSRFADLDPIVYYEEAIEADPNFAEALESIGYCNYVFSDDNLSAERYFRLALSLDPTRVDSHIGLARVLWERDMCDEAIACLTDGNSPVRSDPRIAAVIEELRRSDSS